MTTAVIESPAGDTLPMREFTVSNHLLGDREALQAAWDRDGYWFFRDVLDKGAIDRLRGVYLEELNKLGLIDPTRDDMAIYTGGSLEDYPITNNGNPHGDPVLSRHPMKQFTADPAIKAFFTELLGDEPYFVPNTEYHAAPPKKGHNGSRFNYLHADGANNKGLPLKICWIPLAEIDERTGGLALTEGLHKPRIGDFARPPEGIASDVIPDDAWRRTIYQPGDLLMFSLESPHSGLANLSEDRFRLSCDVRVMRKSDNVPMVGKIRAIDRNAVTVASDEGEEKTFRLSEDTFCRITRGRLSGMPLALDEITQYVKIGDPVYVASNDGVATFMRPQH